MLTGLVVLAVVAGGIIYIALWKMKHDTDAAYNLYITQAPYDAIIVPGIPYDSTQQNILFKVRMLWAKNLFDKGITKNIIFSGAAVHSAWIEGKVMKIMADSMGIPSANTFYEDKAEHGNENVYYSWKLAQRLGLKKIALATDQYQNSFLTSFLQKRTPDIAQLPVSTDSFPVYDKKQLPLIDASKAHVNNFVPLKERESRWQRFRSSFTIQVKEKN